jgi:hypothetical protein
MKPMSALILRSRAPARRLEDLILRSALLGARLEGWPRGPWFETALKKRLLTMRFPFANGFAA